MRDSDFGRSFIVQHLNWLRILGGYTSSSLISLYSLGDGDAWERRTQTEEGCVKRLSCW
ncbi:hypothetical protein CBM2598_U10299 [Cupriavidus taiwanensis]|uniref:Uncharacterized protein n=1 Tax=Cupriavidus taiwanensis TaxID=164546 RepID=A0A7Z7JHN8_9BURK|nr:hypothetical protein CBM2597_U10052 [Cupriavidus taiwanensis]SOZ96513.1 hypothetical protein CBM2598_U10299 [Cupriavidus taiwanensis]SPC25558.1 hypothetical protein CBM2594_U10059 [Cupriavidus taiwanensis]